MTSARQVFGIEELDRELGGGLIPGTLTVVAGATGVGKTQLGTALGQRRFDRRRTPWRSLRLDEPRRFSKSQPPIARVYSAGICENTP